MTRIGIFGSTEPAISSLMRVLSGRRAFIRGKWIFHRGPQAPQMIPNSLYMYVEDSLSSYENDTNKYLTGSICESHSTNPFTSLYTDLPAPLGHISQPNPKTKSSSRPTPTRPIAPSSRPNLQSKPRGPTNMDVPRLRATSPL
jgi:hypothetical protein